jgi:hypothetical protein
LPRGEVTGKNGAADGPESRSRPWVPETEAEQNAIREQLERILASSPFRNSKRYPTLLRFTVERALAGGLEHLKERTLGVQVFGREPDYDTNQDPIVRATAVEIRKRIAQYYNEAGRENEIRIEFPPGSYVPEFKLPPRVPVENSAPPVAKQTSRRWPLLSLASIATLALVVFLFRPATKLTPFDAFWAPVVDSPAPALLCVAGNHATSPELEASNRAGENPPPVTVSELQHADQIAFSDATALSQIAGILRWKSKSYRIRRTSATSLADLRDGPVVLVGAFNNYWTLKTTGQLRFRLMRQGHVLWIEDRLHPAVRAWQVDTSVPYTELAEDYAIVARFLDPTIGRIVVVAGGLTRYGTMAAGEFLAEPGYLDQAFARTGGDGKRKNIEFVIATKVVDRISGPPKVLAVTTW